MKAKTSPKKTKSPKPNPDKSIKLDLACGGNKQPGYVGMDVIPYPGVDIIHDATIIPWPLKEQSVRQIVASHFLEHVPGFGVDARLQGLIDLLISKKLITKKEAMKSFGEHHIFSLLIAIFDEAWRVLEVGGQFAFVVPYYSSKGFAQDPTHVKELCEATIMYFDPEHESGLWNFYKPKPWKIEMSTFSGVGNMEVLMSKRDITPYEEIIKAWRQ